MSATPAIATVGVSGSTITITPVALGTTNITVTARDTAGQTVTQTFVLTVSGDAAAVAAPSISITPAAVTVTVGTAIANITITSTGGAVDSYGIAPDLPAGLSIDTTTGTISGTPDAAAAAVTYTITATNASGSTDTATVAITVNAAPTTPVAAPSISISTDTLTATAGVAIATITIDPTAGGAVVSYNVSPTLTAGLSFDTATGSISGTPDAAAAAATYTITATNASGTNAATVAITVNAAPIAAPIISISPATVTATAGALITPITITNNGGAVPATGAYSIDPAITNGLSFSVDTGAISGTPDAEAVEVTYTITASNASGTAMATVAITVNAAVELAKQLNKDILPRLIQTMLASTRSAVNHRIDATFSGNPQAGSYRFDGQTLQLDGDTSLSANLEDLLEQKLPTYVRALQDETMDLKQMLGNSSFVLPLNALDGNGSGSGVTIWGSGDYSNLSDGGWKGDVFSFQLGVDQRVGADLLAGGLVSWSEGDVDYTLGGESGEYQHQITSIHPYMAHSRDGVELWGSVGYGRGKLAIKQQEDHQRTSDTRLLSLSAGVSGELSESGQSGLNLKSDIALAQIDIDGSADNRIAADKLSSQRLRLVLEVEQEHQLASGGQFKPSLEIGARYDGGAGNSGVGAILGFGGRYANTTGLSVEGKVHSLVGRNNYKEWGVSGVIRQQTGINGQGLSFSLSPSYGATGNSANQVWERKLSDGNNRDDDYNGEKMFIH